MKKTKIVRIFAAVVVTLAALFFVLIVALLANAPSYAFSSCGRPDYANNYIVISIKEEYRQKYEAAEFRPEDFNFDNAERISYMTQSGDPLIQAAYMPLYLYLKRGGKKYLDEAVVHCLTLDFVHSAAKENYARWN